MLSTGERDRAAGRSGTRASRQGAARAASVQQLSRADRVARGKDARAVAPPDGHAEFGPGRSRDRRGACTREAGTADE